MTERDLVLRSIERPDGLVCVDILAHAGGGFGFAEYRRDPEDPGGWRATGRRAAAPLETAEVALAEARRLLPWLAVG